MNKIAGLFAGLGFAWILAGLVCAVAWVQGIYMVFHASMTLGIISLFFQVPYPAEAVVYWFTGYDIAAHLATAFGM